MKIPETPEAKATTFTKRRSGLFTKVAELCMICDAQVAMKVKSPNKSYGRKKIYSFGHSSVHNVFNAFLNNGVPDAAHDKTQKYAVSLYNESKASEYDLDHYVQNKKRNREVDSGYWWEVEDLDNILSVKVLRLAVERMDNIQSIKVLRLAVERMKKLKEDVKTKLNLFKSSKNNKHINGESQYDHDFDDFCTPSFVNSIVPESASSFSTVGQKIVEGIDNIGRTHFKHGNNVITNNDNNYKHNGESQCDRDYDYFPTLAPREFFNDYNPSLSSIYGPNYVNPDYTRTVPTPASNFSNVGQIVEGNEQKCGFQQAVTSSASKYVNNFDKSYVGGEYNTKKVDECMGVEFKDKEANSWAITAQNIPSFGYLNKDVRDSVYNAKLDQYWTAADSTSNSNFLNVGNNEAPLFMDSIRS